MILREIDMPHLIRNFISRIPEHLSAANPRISPEQARSILSKLGICTYSQIRETFSARMGIDRIFVALQQRWVILPRRQTIRLLVDAFAMATPYVQRIEDWSWIPSQGAIVGIQKEALDMLGDHAWTGFAPLRETIADLVAYVTSARYYVIDTKHVQRALDLRFRA